VPEFYRDVAVIAYRLPTSEKSMSELLPRVTSSVGNIDERSLSDGDLTTAVALPYGEANQPAWIEFDFGHQQTVQSLTLAMQATGTLRSLIDPARVAAELRASVDGAAFQTITVIHESVDAEQTVTFAPTSARYFRLLLPNPPAQGSAVATVLAGVPQQEHRIAELILHTTPRVEHFEQKAGFFVGNGMDRYPTPHILVSDVIRHRDVVDLSRRMRADGTLNWRPPAGRWAILRFGYSLLGTTNRPASIEATGLEVDKLSRADVKSHIDSYLARLRSILGPELLGQRGLHALVNDSWEVGAQNWSAGLPAEFARRRGYRLEPWLPALTGQIIEDSEATDRFLWDFRRTIADLVAENHYGQIAASLHQHDLIFYNESHEYGRVFIGDGMDAKRDDDVPMGAMWTGNFRPQEPYDADLRESASVAHIYGQNLVAAESFTTFGAPGSAYAYRFSPENLKPTADREFANGVNRFVIHTSVHQALIDKAPGITLGPVGQWFTRNETWAELAAPWITYLARSSYLLQQGHFVADVVYYYGEDSNVTALYAERLPLVPQGYAFDFASADALSKLSVKDGLLVTASGMSYRVLALDPRVRLMSLDVLRRIAELIAAGATVVGEKPQATPSLADSKMRFQALVRDIWGPEGVAEHGYGKGRVLRGKSLEQALEELKLKPDFDYSKPDAQTTVWYIHRRLADGELYFVNNRKDRSEWIEASFRVSGKAPELWHADTGIIEPAPYRHKGDHTVVPLRLEPNDAVFVVFRESAEQDRREIPELIRLRIDVALGPWRVSFQPGRGAPESATFAELRSWTTDPNPGIKYFSGTAEYETTLTVPAAALVEDQCVEIDLGEVKNVAEVSVNGQSLGVLWKPPFRTDVTHILHAGANRLTVRVTNLWPNRLIGDHQPGMPKVAFATFDPFQADSSLLPSGLLGPVVIQSLTQRPRCLMDAGAGAG
jgi:hypothetical protein